MRTDKMPTSLEWEKIKEMALNTLDSYTPFGLELHHDLNALELSVAITMHRLASSKEINPYEYIPDFIANVAKYLEQLPMSSKN